MTKCSRLWDKSFGPEAPRPCNCRRCMRCLSHLATLHLAALLSQQAAVSLPCPSALQKKSIILRFSAVLLAPFVAHWLAAVDVGTCECCPAWLTGSFITWLPCWDNTAGNHQARRKAWLWLFPLSAAPRSFPRLARILCTQAAFMPSTATVLNFCLITCVLSFSRTLFSP